MLFIQNKYHDWYYNIINCAQLRASTREEAKSILGYVESHHVIPKALGGDNSTENRAYLTAREHFICHCLLSKFTAGDDRHKMLAAIVGMKRKRKYQERYINSRLYQSFKLEFSKVHSLMLSGAKQSPEFIEKRIAPLRGKKQDPNRIALRALKNTGKKRTKDQCQTMRQAQLNSPNKKVYADYSEEKQKSISDSISKGLTGKPKSDTHKKELSKSLRGKTKGMGKSETTKQRMRKPKSREHAIAISDARILMFESMRLFSFILLTMTLLPDD